MDPITLTAISIYVADKLIAQFIKEEGYSRFREFFFRKQRYQNRLAQVIIKTITEFEEKHPVTHSTQFPFYHSEILFSQLSKQLLFKEDNLIPIVDIFKINSNIIPPSQAELDEFYSSFIDNIKADKKLRKLYIEEYYQEEVFNISQGLKNTNFKLDEISSGIKFIHSRETKEVLLDENYIERKIDLQLIGSLKEKNVLLLTGISFCGKTETAKKISSHFVSEGYEFGIFNDVFQTSQFLRNQNKRIAILEDPFGHDIETESFSSWKKMGDLIRSIAPFNKLIVTSRFEIIKSVNKAASLEECKILGYGWVDLTCNDRQFLSEAWDAFSNKTKFPEKYKTVIIEYLRDADLLELLQVGQLYVLSRYEKGDIEYKSLPDLLSLARKDSQEISVDIQNRGDSSRHLFIALALSADTITGVAELELSYLFSNIKVFPGIEDNSEIVFSRRRKEKSEFPDYGDLSAIPDAINIDINFFEGRGYIRRYNDLIYFTHPTYREAARILLRPIKQNFWNEVMNYSERCLASLNPDTAKNCLRQVSNLLYSEYPEREGQLINLIYKAAMGSIFPAVRDRSFIILLNNLSLLDEKETDNIIHRITYEYNSSSISWINNFPFIEKGISLISRISYRPNFEIEVLRERVGSNDYSVKDLWDFLLIVYQEKKIVSYEESVKIFSVDEAFIRVVFVDYYFALFESIEFDMLDQIFQDDHPSVVFAAVRRAVLIYPNLIDDLKHKIEKLLLSSLSNKYIVIRSNDLITTFGIDYGNDSIKWSEIDPEHKVQLWQLWAKLFIVFLKKLPTDVRFYNPGRFFVTIEKSSQFLTSVEGLGIADSYLEFYSRFLEQKYLPSTMITPMYVLIIMTKEDREHRFYLFESFFLIQNTSFTLQSLKVAIDLWEFLTLQEREKILNLLNEERIDKNFIWAACITRHEVPTEIQQIIFGRKDFLLKSPLDIYEEMERKLFEDSVRMIYGRPYIFENLNLTNIQHKLWVSIVKEILKKPDDSLYLFAVDIMVYDIINTATELWQEDGLTIWSSVCKIYDFDMLAEVLIDASILVTFNIDYAHDLWDCLFERAKELDKSNELALKVLNNIEGIEFNMTDPDEFFEVFGNEFGNLIISKSEPDSRAIKLILEYIKEGKFSEFSDDGGVAEIAQLGEEAVYRFKLTFSLIEEMIYIGRLTIENETILKLIPNEIYGKGEMKYEIREKREKLFDEDPPNWIMPDLNNPNYRKD